jgi:dipeptidyl aminopeptidase/acylaminoacyl peptidase
MQYYNSEGYMKRNLLFAKALLIVITLVLTQNLLAQGKLSDYQRADTVDKWRDLVYNTVTRPQWLPDGKYIWYQTQTPKGKEYILVDLETKKKSSLFDQVKFAQKFSEVSGKAYAAYKLTFDFMRYNKQKNELEFSVENVRWLCKLDDYSIKKQDPIPPRTGERGFWGEADDELKGEPVVSPDGSWEAFIKNSNVYIRLKKDKSEYQLSFDGSPGDYYSCYLKWSPDSKKIAVNKIRPNVKRYFYMVESSPSDQLQPKLHKREYLKPGDALPFFRPQLFDVTAKTQIPVDEQIFENQYDLTTPAWHKDSRGFTIEFNQRGHQQYRVDEIDAVTGNVKNVIDETSKTFVCYSYNFRRDIDDGKEIIWKSERDGWQHLYLYDGLTGKVKNQITKGEWVVREVVRVDEKSREIIFKGSGMNAGEDPYFVHLYKVNFDGTGLAELTPEKANHDAVFSSDWNYFVDTYSKVDMPPVSVIRAASDGKVIMELEKADITELLKTGWKAPEVFKSKARDGKTDIWGIIIKPSNFNPKKKYPVIEYIYAGPGGFYTPKSFAANFRMMNTLAELGFIIVQCDGMGTGMRSRAFQDIIWKNIKDGGFEDRKIWIKEAAKKYAYMDITKMGIYGGSAGGQISTAALLFHPDFYKVAVSTCGCHDNRMDKIWWNELWMGYPLGPQYEESSNVANAYRLKGNLMLVVGELDDNVDPASTMQVVNALVKAKKDFELVVIPGAGHAHDLPHIDRKRKDFFVRNIMGVNPPDWNSLEK